MVIAITQPHFDIKVCRGICRIGDFETGGVFSLRCSMKQGSAGLPYEGFTEVLGCPRKPV